MLPQPLRCGPAASGIGLLSSKDEHQSRFYGRVAKCSRGYLQQALELKPTAEEFIDWVDTQPSAVRVLLLSLGPAYCWESYFLVLLRSVRTKGGRLAVLPARSG